MIQNKTYTLNKNKLHNSKKLAEKLLGSKWNHYSDSQLATPANLAQLEYDWFAAVIERFCLLVFFIFFSLMSFGINALGLYYWQFTKIQ